MKKKWTIVSCCIVSGLLLIGIWNFTKADSLQAQTDKVILSSDKTETSLSLPLEATTPDSFEESLQHQEEESATESDATTENSVQPADESEDSDSSENVEVIASSATIIKELAQEMQHQLEEQIRLWSTRLQLSEDDLVEDGTEDFATVLAVYALRHEVSIEEIALMQAVPMNELRSIYWELNRVTAVHNQKQALVRVIRVDPVSQPQLNGTEKTKLQRLINEAQAVFVK